MRTFLGCILLAAMFSAAGFAADEKIDAKKLLGKWEPKEPKKDFAMRIEIEANGKLSITTQTNDTKTATTGTWKLDGNKLTMVLAAGENETKDTITITKLTDDELEAEDAKKEKKQSLKRVK